MSRPDCIIIEFRPRSPDDPPPAAGGAPSRGRLRLPPGASPAARALALRVAAALAELTEDENERRRAA
jgi:hypothetical protein